MVGRLWQDSGNRVAICVLTLPELKGRSAVEVPDRHEVERAFSQYVDELTASLVVDRKAAQSAMPLRESVDIRPLVDAVIEPAAPTLTQPCWYTETRTWPRYRMISCRSWYFLRRTLRQSDSPKQQYVRSDARILGSSCMTAAPETGVSVLRLVRVVRFLVTVAKCYPEPRRIGSDMKCDDLLKYEPVSPHLTPNDDSH